MFNVLFVLIFKAYLSFIVLMLEIYDACDFLNIFLPLMSVKNTVLNADVLVLLSVKLKILMPVSRTSKIYAKTATGAGTITFIDLSVTGQLVER